MGQCSRRAHQHSSPCATTRPGFSLCSNSAQGRLTLDLHGYSAWTAQLAVLSMLRSLLRQHRTQGRITDQLSRLDIITGRGNRRWDCVGGQLAGWGAAHGGVVQALGRAVHGGTGGVRLCLRWAALLHASTAALPLIFPRPSPTRPLASARKHQPIVREIVVEMLQHLLPVTLSRNNDGLLLLEARKLARLFNTLQGPDPLSVVAMQHCLVDPGQ